MATLFAALVAALVAAVLAALPIAELVLARQAHAELCGLETEPETVRTDGSATVFLLMDFVRMEKREAAEREFASRYVEGGRSPPPCPDLRAPTVRAAPRGQRPARRLVQC